jgi:hypothetical protein
MITEKKYLEIRKTWEPSKVYANWHEIETRLRLLYKYGLRYLAKRDVIEPGANAGIAGVMISPFINSYIGLEPDSRYYQNQLVHTEPFIECPHEIQNMTLGDFVDAGGEVCGNALLASFVLYHFSDAEVDLLKEKILPHINSFVIMNRGVDRKLNKNKYIFNRYRNTEKFLLDNGFKVSLSMWDKHKVFYLIVGTK